MSDEKMTADKFVRNGYSVSPSSNGGFLVSIPDYGRIPGSDNLAAFTNSTDFLAWLTAGHAIYDKGIVR